MYFIRALRHWVQQYGSDNIVYFDESGFAEHSYRSHGWALQGTRVYGKITGNKRKNKTNLIMAQRKKEWLAPMLFEGGCTHQTVLAWMEQTLIPELQPNSLVIMDNAPFHNKPKIKQLLEQHGHTLMPLPTYSPDLKSHRTILRYHQTTKASFGKKCQRNSNRELLMQMTITIKWNDYTIEILQKQNTAMPDSQTNTLKGILSSKPWKKSPSGSKSTNRKCCPSKHSDSVP